VEAIEFPSTKPYLLRAIWEWCADNGFTPYLSVVVDEFTHVPREYVRDGQIVLNIGSAAASKLQMGNDYIEFHARFNGVARSLSVPVGRVVAIYARENGAGMTFELEETLDGNSERLPIGSTMIMDSSSEPNEPPDGGGKPRLRVVK
jgi:stringent starvation protein B